MNAIDWTPLYRNSVGYDRLTTMLNSASRTDPVGMTPAYNIEVMDEDQYAITVVVAGYEQAELDIEVDQRTLIVSGKKSEEGDTQYLYQGIVLGSFERKFNLAEHVEVIDARLSNGLLTIHLKREVPESLKPRIIPIQHGEAAKDQAVSMLSNEAA